MYPYSVSISVHPNEKKAISIWNYGTGIDILDLQKNQIEKELESDVSTLRSPVSTKDYFYVSYQIPKDTTKTSHILRYKIISVRIKNRNYSVNADTVLVFNKFKKAWGLKNKISIF